MDERFFQGIREFNERRYFEAHDVLEYLWQGYRDPDRAFLQALIQTAVGFYFLYGVGPDSLSENVAGAFSRNE